MVILAAILCFSAWLVMPHTVNAETVDGGVCGENMTWSLDSTGTLTISGSGPMSAYTDRNHAPWWSYRDMIESVVLEDGVTSVGNYAFIHCDRLCSVTLPDTVSSIGLWAFYHCAAIGYHSRRNYCRS